MDDLISRQAAIDKFVKLGDYYDGRDEVKRGIHQCIAATYDLPSAQPEVIHCKDCVKHNIGVDDTPYKSYVCPLVKFRGKAQGHEFDYQYCVYGVKKENETD